jgi:hypothetical protein
MASYARPRSSQSPSPTVAARGRARGRRTVSSRHALAERAAPRVRALPSITATQLLVVPRSMPMTSLPFALRAWTTPPARDQRQRAASSSRECPWQFRAGASRPLGSRSRAAPRGDWQQVAPEGAHGMAQRPRLRKGGTAAEEATTQRTQHLGATGAQQALARPRTRAATAGLSRRPHRRRTGRGKAREAPSSGAVGP